MRAGLLAAVCLTLGTTSLRAQDARARVGLQLLRDSLSYARDTTMLLSLEARNIELARADRDNPIHHLRLGLIALRLGELIGRRHWDDAYGEFQWAAELRPAWPWPWYGIGLTAARAPNKAEGFAGGLYAMIGEDRHRLAGDAFAKAVAMDPTFTDGLRAFAETARETTIDAPLLDALTALRVGMVSPLSWDGELLMERGRLERLAGFPDSAVVAFRRALQLGARPALAWLELARTYPLVIADSVGSDEDATARAYYAGAGTEDGEVVAEYRRDLEPILEAPELAAFDSLQGQERVAWLKTFWHNRDALDLRAEGSRMREHFRRWQYARQEFRFAPFRRRHLLGLEIFRSGDAELDDRGIVYLRHGEPSTRIVWPAERRANTLVPLDYSYGSETWRYRRPDGDLILHFLAREDQSDYRAVESVFALDVPLDVLESRAHEIPGLAQLLYAGQYTQPALQQQERLRGRRSLAVATQSDSWERDFETLLKGRVQWYATGVVEGKPLVHLVYTVDAEAIRALPGKDPVPITLRGGFFTAKGVAVATIDTVQYLYRPAPETRLLALRAEATVPPGNYRIRVGVDAGPQLGAIYPVDSLRVPDVLGDTLELSALLIGMPQHGLSWVVSREDTVWLDPLPVYQPHDTMTLYVEAYGAVAPHPYTLRVTLSRQRGTLSRLLRGKGDQLELTEEATLGGSRSRIRRSLALGGLEPGEYVLEVVVEGNGQVSRRRRGLVIRE